MKEKGKIENTLGMFDLLKGIMMILIVFAHNRSIFPSLIFERSTVIADDSYLRFLTYVYNVPVLPRLVFTVIVLFLVSQMPALLIIGGYGHRKRNVAKGFKALARELLVPYFVTVLITTVFNCCFHYAFFRYLPGAISESLKVFGGMVLGLSQTVTIGDLTLFANGPIWYILAMFWSLAIFNAVLNYAKEEHIPYYAVAISIVGWLFSFVKIMPLCLSQGLVGVVFVYMGYYAKKKKLLLKEYDIKEKILFVLLVIIPNLIQTYFGLVTEMADNAYSLGPITYIENGLMGIFFLYIFIRMNSITGRISGLLRTIGRYSLYIMCIHTIEMIAIPWYTFSSHFGEHQLLGFFVIFLVRLVIILCSCFAFVKAKELIIRRIALIKEKKRNCDA